MQSSQQTRAAGRAVSCLAAVVGVLAGCAGGEAPHGPGGAGSGGPGPSPDQTGKTPTACTVANDTTISTGAATSPAIAFGDQRFAVAWTDRSHDAGDVILTLLDRDGRAVHEEPIARGAGTATSPAVAHLPGGGFVVIWEQMGNGGGTVRGLRVDDDGKPKGSPFAVSSTVGPEAHPNVAETASGAAVAWTTATGASMARIVNDGVDEPIAVPGAAQVALAGSGDALGALWTAGSQIGFAKLTMPLRTAQTAHPALFRSATGSANLPRLAAAEGGAFLAAWEDNRAGVGNETVRVTRISADGTPGEEIQLSPAGGSANYPDVAWLGSAGAVVYYQFRDGPPAVYLSLVTPVLHPSGDGLRISGREPARFPRAAWGDGTLGVTYAEGNAEHNGPVHLAVVTCK